MKYYIIFVALGFLMARCENELGFEYRTFEKKTKLPCEQDCPHISVRVPIAKEVPVVADSINKKVFSVMKEIIYFGEKPYTATDYNGLMDILI